MLKKEAELRKRIRYAYDWPDTKIKREVSQLITALVRAVRADERENTIRELQAHDWRCDLQMVSTKKAAAIRRG